MHVDFKCKRCGQVVTVERTHETQGNPPEFTCPGCKKMPLVWERFVEKEFRHRDWAEKVKKDE